MESGVTTRNRVPETILIVNAGSSSLKLRLLGADDEVFERVNLPAIADPSDIDQLAGVLRKFPAVQAAGHRVVHGGAEFRESVLVTGEVLERLRALSDLAPLHNPAALAGLDVMRAAAPGIPNVACFDTAFHASLPPAAATYAVPRQWTEEWGIRRYGFHGLNHAYTSRRVAELLSRPAEELRIVSCHLGAGASLAAVAGGRSVDTTMGFTPMEGLVMATRSGSVDPGALIYVQRHRGLTVGEVERVLDEESGIRGLSGRSADMRVVEQAAGEGDPRAKLALDVYVHRLRAGIAAMAASMGGLDVLAFTGGVGEGSAYVRAAAVAGLAFLGLRLDPDRNAGDIGTDIELSPEDARVQVLLVHAREDLQIAREVRAVLAG